MDTFWATAPHFTHKDFIHEWSEDNISEMNFGVTSSISREYVGLLHFSNIMKRYA